MDSWTTLTLAVRHSWGEESKKQELISELADVIINTQVDREYLEEFLEYYMEEHYQTILEDGSQRQIAEVLLQLYAEVERGETAVLSQLRQLRPVDVEQCRKQTPV